MKLYNQTDYYQGKVRDVYNIGTENILLYASDRISAFDHILPRTIPFKGQVLNQTASYFLVATKDIVPSWWLDAPIAEASYGLRCDPIAIEVVVRGNLTGHALREYKEGKRTLCGVSLPEGLKDNAFFESPIITPTTKATEGHDMDISRSEIIEQKIVDVELYAQIEEVALQLFDRGRKMADEVGLVLVDTKYEFGLFHDQLMLMDEIHTPDSSRYFEKEGLNSKIEKGEKPDQLSKEFVREWLMAEGFQGKPGQTMPEMDDATVDLISKRYINLYERLTQQGFLPSSTQDAELELNAYLQDVDT